MNIMCVLDKTCKFWAYFHEAIQLILIDFNWAVAPIYTTLMNFDSSANWL